MWLSCERNETVLLKWQPQTETFMNELLICLRHTHREQMELAELPLSLNLHSSFLSLEAFSISVSFPSHYAPDWCECAWVDHVVLIRLICLKGRYLIQMPLNRYCTVIWLLWSDNKGLICRDVPNPSFPSRKWFLNLSISKYQLYTDTSFSIVTTNSQCSYWRVLLPWQQCTAGSLTVDNINIFRTRSFTFMIYNYNNNFVFL